MSVYIYIYIIGTRRRRRRQAASRHRTCATLICSCLCLCRFVLTYCYVYCFMCIICYIYFWPEADSRQAGARKGGRCLLPGGQATPGLGGARGGAGSWDDPRPRWTRPEVAPTCAPFLGGRRPWRPQNSRRGAERCGSHVLIIMIRIIIRIAIAASIAITLTLTLPPLRVQGRQPRRGPGPDSPRLY